MRGMPNDAEKNPDADKLAELRDMEAKVRRMRDNRNSFRDQGKAMAKAASTRVRGVNCSTRVRDSTLVVIKICMQEPSASNPTS